MNPNVIMGGAILKAQPGGGCTTPLATSFLEVMDVLGRNADGTVEVVGRSTGADDSNYRPFALYGGGIRLTLRPEACELVSWRCWESWEDEQAPPSKTSLWRRFRAGSERQERDVTRRIRMLYGPPDSWRHILIDTIGWLAGGTAVSAVLLYWLGLSSAVAIGLMVVCLVSYWAVLVTVSRRRRSRRRADLP